MITTRDQLINALGNNRSRIVIDKVSIASQAAGSYVSMWRATGQPGQGAIPSTAATCNHNTTGGIPFTQQVSPATSYIAWLCSTSSNAAMTMELHDRLAHMGGLSGTVTAAQTVGINLATLGGTDNVTARKGDSTYADVTWWLEWYTATGGTAVTATVAVTYNDDSTGNLSNVSLAATRPAGFCIPLNGYIPAAKAGLYIKSVDTVTLSATTGTAGSFGVTATRLRSTAPMMIANKTEVYDWAQTGLAEIFNSSCLFVIMITSTTSTGTLRSQGKIIHG